MKTSTLTYFLGKLVLIVALSMASHSYAQTGCTIIQSNCPPSDLTPVCADNQINGVLGANVSWTPPSFSLSCPGGGSGGTGYAFQMSFDLPESQNGCWLYSRVQRTGTGGGRLRLWQSTQTNTNPNPNFTTPAFFLPSSATNCEITVTNGSGNNFTCNVYLINSDGTLSPVNTSFTISGTNTYNFSVTPALQGIYRLFFEFTGNGNNSDYVELLQIDASLYGASCTGDINFATTSNYTPGNFFPVGITPVTYTAVCNSCSPVLTSSCSFNVVVNGVTATAAKTDANCALNNGTITITGSSSNTSPALQYNINNGSWTNFNSPYTISGLNQGTYVINVRDYFSNLSGYCQIITPLSVTVNRISDISTPSITCPAPINIEGCSTDAITVSNTGLIYSSSQQSISLSQFMATGASASDACGLTSWKYQDSQSGTCPIIVTRLFTVADASGNTANCTQIITISHSNAPVVPANGASTVPCPNIALAPLTPVVNDACGTPVNAVLISIVDTPDPLNCEGTKTYNYNYTDCAGLVSAWSYTYTIEREDFTLPANGSSTVACIANATLPVAPAVTDNCGNTLTPAAPVTGGTYNGCEGTRTYTFTYTDCEGNTHDWVYTYTIEREDFTLPANGSSTVACVANATLPVAPAVTDNCGNTLTPAAPVTGGTYNGCEGTRTYTFTYTDCEGNTHDWVYTYTIEREDFTLPANGSSTVACIANASLPVAPAITDNCGNTLTPAAPVTGGTYNGCEGTRTYTFTYTDCEGNTHDWVYTYTIEREDFTLPANGSSTVACIANATLPVAPAVTDNCGNILTPAAPVTGGTYNGCEGTRTYTFNYTDCEGNTHDWVYTYTIEREDFTLPANGSSTVACVANATLPVAPAVTDNCGNTLTPAAPVTGGTYNGCEGTRTYTFTYTDCEGNTHDWVYTYTIEREDFTLPANGSSTVACIANASLPVAPAITDNCGNTLTPAAPVTGGTYNGCEGTRTYTFTYTDCEGNTHDWVYTYTIEREDFTLPANGSSTVACIANATLPVAPEVTDNCGNILTPAAPVTGGTYNGCEGTRTYTFTYTDCEGNTHDWVYTYTIEREDFTLPANGSSTVACIANATLPVAPAVTDNCGNALTPAAPVTGGTYNGCEGTRTYTFTYTDCEGNTHDWVYTYTIEREDFTLPANGSSTVACIANATLPVAPAVTDNCGNTLTPAAPVTGGTYNGCEGTRTYTFTYTDCEGNTHDWVYTYTIEREDFTLPANGSSTVACIANATLPVAPAVTDNCGNTLTPAAPVTGGTYNGCEGTRTYTFTYTDCEGNTHDWVYTYTIERADFTLPANGSSTVACIANATLPVAPAVTDNCGNTLTPAAPVTGGTYNGCEGTRTYTFTYTDCEGNTQRLGIHLHHRTRRFYVARKRKFNGCLCITNNTAYSTKCK
jgi:hypothetical protein